MECSICYNKLNKIYRELSCGHRFHHKCLKLCEDTSNNDIYSCPYCRNKYENMILRTNFKYNGKKRKDVYTNVLSKMVIDVNNAPTKKDKVDIVNNIFQYILKEDNVAMVLNKKFGFQKFLDVVITKVNELSYDVHEDGNITKEQCQEFKKNRELIIEKFNHSF